MPASWRVSVSYSRTCLVPATATSEVQGLAAIAVTAVVRGVTATGSSRTCSGLAIGPSGLPEVTATAMSTLGLLDFFATLDLVSSRPPAIHLDRISSSLAFSGAPSGGMKGSSFLAQVVHRRLASELPASTTAPPPPPAITAPKLVRSRSPFFLSGLWQEKHLFSSSGRTWSS